MHAAIDLIPRSHCETGQKQAGDRGREGTATSRPKGIRPELSPESDWAGFGEIWSTVGACARASVAGRFAPAPNFTRTILSQPEGCGAPGQSASRVIKLMPRGDRWPGPDIAAAGKGKPLPPAQGKLEASQLCFLAAG
jgi:hypothetical protein